MLTPTPQERVEAYIRDWHLSWKECGGGKLAGADLVVVFEKWHAAVEALTAKHWASGSRDESGSRFGGSPDHDPATESVRRAEITGDTAVVESEGPRSSSPRVFEYGLRKEGDSWRIASVLEFHDDEDEPVFPKEELDQLLGMPDSRAVLPLPEEGDEPNCDILFLEGHVVNDPSGGEPEAIQVRGVGAISLPSGMIVARDFGHSPEEARPLSRCVRPGDYDVEVSLLRGCIAAIRILFDESSPGPFSFRRAVTVDGDDSMIGVDGGNVALCDARSFMQRTKRDHTRDQTAWFSARSSAMSTVEDITFLRLSGSDLVTAVISGSGDGDGAYPAFWVFDSQDHLVALVVDFLVAAEFPHRSVRIPWVAGQSGVIYQEPRLSVSIDRSEGVRVVGGHLSDLRWLDASGTPFASGNEMGSSSHGDERCYYVDVTKLDEMATELEILIDAGYRNKR